MLLVLPANTKRFVDFLIFVKSVVNLYFTVDKKLF